MMDGLFSLVFGLLALFLVLWLYILLPAGMAERRNRNRLIWVLISLFGSPVLACLLLLALGDAE
jgi:fumarate reductase subunit D